MDNKNGLGITIGLTAMIPTIILAILKLCGVIKFSWVWVLAPTWIPVAIIVLVVSVLFIISLIGEC